MKTLYYGCVLPLIRDSPLSTSPVEFPAYKAGTVRHIALGLAMAEMVEKGAVEPVEDCRASFYTRVFLVPKVTGDWRPIFDLSILNSFLEVTPFRMETVASWSQ